MWGDDGGPIRWGWTRLLATYLSTYSLLSWDVFTTLAHEELEFLSATLIKMMRPYRSFYPFLQQLCKFKISWNIKFARTFSRRFNKPTLTNYDDYYKILPPIYRGKKSHGFFPLPNGIYNKKTRTVRSPLKRDSEEIEVPWEMRYYVPMLRG